mmetsp:Transcript_11157/g.37988  ORF Transcript_11157/g.37988 Transcript_11157/m.37988 type:complete len:378 (+) Transcript_11157:3-1136(+)
MRQPGAGRRAQNVQDHHHRRRRRGPGHRRVPRDRQRVCRPRPPGRGPGQAQGGRAGLPARPAVPPVPRRRRGGLDRHRQQRHRRDHRRRAPAAGRVAARAPRPQPAHHGGHPPARAGPLPGRGGHRCLKPLRRHDKNGLRDARLPRGPRLRLGNFPGLFPLPVAYRAAPGSEPLGGAHLRGRGARGLLRGVLRGRLLRGRAPPGPRGQGHGPGPPHAGDQCGPGGDRTQGLHQHGHRLRRGQAVLHRAAGRAGGGPRELQRAPGAAPPRGRVPLRPLRAGQGRRAPRHEDGPPGVGARKARAELQRGARGGEAGHGRGRRGQGVSAVARGTGCSRGATAPKAARAPPCLDAALRPPWPTARPPPFMRVSGASSRAHT